MKVRMIGKLFVLILSTTLPSTQFAVRAQDGCRCIGNPGCPCLQGGGGSGSTSSGGRSSSNGSSSSSSSSNSNSHSWNSRDYPHTSKSFGGGVHPDPGYHFVNNDPDDFDVELNKGLMQGADGLYPAPGYHWASKRKKDFRVVGPGNGYHWVNEDDPNDNRVELNEGLVANADGTVRPAAGYHWVNGDDQDDNRVELNEGLVANADGSLRPAAGYHWVNWPNRENVHDFRVAPNPGLVANADGSLRPAPGYRWVNWPNKENVHDFRVAPNPGLVANADGSLRPAAGYHWVNWPNKENVHDFRIALNEGLLANADGSLHPTRGYRWVNRADPNDLSVARDPGLLTNAEGSIHPAPGYRWVDTDDPNDIRIFVPLSDPDITNILNSVARKEDLPKGPDYEHDPVQLNCSNFFRGVGAELRSRGYSVGEEWMNGNLQANDIISIIKNSGDWQEVDAKEAQRLANNGAIVEGVAEVPGGHGHLATVNPAPEGIDQGVFGEGPFVRDGVEHLPEDQADGRLHASTWGTVKASKAFSYETNPPKWYVWRPHLK